KDSIKFQDSLKYYTPKGKVVYGGGGIMPDIFIPVDTAGITHYFTSCINKGLIYKFAFEFADTNRTILNKFNTAKDILKYLNKQNILERFIKYSDIKGVKRNQQEIEKSKEILDTHLKAHIARNIIDNDGYFPVIYYIDTPLKKAVEIFSK
ncbi:MAG: peptidase S41, partial [Bacteroidia bacterium]|nr:peptidase S41 [Bacteroidia bacterium]